MCPTIRRSRNFGDKFLKSVAPFPAFYLLFKKTSPSHCWENFPTYQRPWPIFLRGRNAPFVVANKSFFQSQTRYANNNIHSSYFLEYRGKPLAGQVRPACRQAIPQCVLLSTNSTRDDHAKQRQHSRKISLFQAIVQ